MFKVLVNYNFQPDPTWIGEDYLIYDRSDDGLDHLTDFDPAKVIKTSNEGQVDFDKLGYLIDNYQDLPEVFLWGKTNLFKYISPEEYELVKDNQTFTPLLTQNHGTGVDALGPYCFYEGGMYYERSNLMYMSDWKYFKSYPEFAHAFQILCNYFVPFPPGGNFILTREVVHRYSPDFYANLRSILPYATNPVEAHYCERAYYTIWR